MNCFHFSVSLGYKTTNFNVLPLPIMLWIAFIFQYLWDTKQQSRCICVTSMSCELLSFFSIFGIQNNISCTIVIIVIVVNCFHFSVSLGYKTTLFHLSCKRRSLWIAFIFQYLWDTKQQVILMFTYILSCELLSFFSIFGIQNNPFKNIHGSRYVVNCFHFSVSLGYKTTS